jgi:hypothetical protein
MERFLERETAKQSKHLEFIKMHSHHRLKEATTISVVIFKEEESTVLLENMSAEETNRTGKLMNTSKTPYMEQNNSY